jgi:hypothetical protein
MAEAMNYTSLVSDIQAYAERSDDEFIAQVPRFIMLAENRLASNIRGLGYLRNVTGNLTNGNPQLAKPARWRETASFAIVTSAGRVWLKPRTYEFCRAYCPDPAVTGQPKYYSDYGYEHFLFAATPDTDYAIELNYYERPEPLDASNQTSWTTQYAPQLILYASLMEAQPYLQRPERYAEFKNLYEEAAGLISSESTRRQVDHTIMRSPE